MPEATGKLQMVMRYLACSGHTRRHPPPAYIIEAASADQIRSAYPLFAEQPILELPGERPDWLSDEQLAFIEKFHVFALGTDEPSWLRTLVEHHKSGDVWEWYALEERPPSGEPISHGELGTWRRFEIGNDLGGLPKRPERWRVAAIEPAPNDRVAAKLVIEPAASDIRDSP